MLLDYTEYLSLGGALEEPAFARHARAAEARIRARTHGRLEGLASPPEEARLCAFEMIEALGALEEAGGRLPTSETNDDLAIAWRDDGRTPEQTLDALVRKWLEGVCVQGVQLLYAGVDA